MLEVPVPVNRVEHEDSRVRLVVSGLGRDRANDLEDVEAMIRPMIGRIINDLEDRENDLEALKNEINYLEGRANDLSNERNILGNRYDLEALKNEIKDRVNITRVIRSQAITLRNRANDLESGAHVITLIIDNVSYIGAVLRNKVISLGRGIDELRNRESNLNVRNEVIRLGNRMDELMNIENNLNGIGRENGVMSRGYDPNAWNGVIEQLGNRIDELRNRIDELRNRENNLNGIGRENRISSRGNRIRSRENRIRSRENRIRSRLRRFSCGALGGIGGRRRQEAENREHSPGI